MKLCRESLLNSCSLSLWAASEKKYLSSRILLVFESHNFCWRVIYGVKDRPHPQCCLDSTFLKGCPIPKGESTVRPSIILLWSVGELAPLTEGSRGWDSDLTFAQQGLYELYTSMSYCTVLFACFFVSLFVCVFNRVRFRVKVCVCYKDMCLVFNKDSYNTFIN